MLFYQITALINAVTSAIVCTLVVVKNPKSLLNRSFGYFTFSVAFWAYSYFLWQTSKDASSALFWCRVLMGGAIFIPSSFLHFSLTLIEQHKKYRKHIIFWYLISISFLVLDFTPFFVKSVEPRLIFPYWPIPGIAYTLFIIMFLGVTVYVHMLIFKHYKDFSPLMRNQVKYLFWGTAIGFLGGSTNYFLWYGIPILPIGNGLVSVYVVTVSYAIIKYRLMDIKVVVSRTGIFVAVYTLVLGIPFAVAFRYKPGLYAAIGDNWWIAPFSLMALLATTGPFIYIYLNRKAEERLLKEQKSYQSILRNASLEMTRFKDLRVLLEFIVHIITGAVRMQFAAVYLLDRDNSYYKLESMRAREGKSGLFPRVEMSCALVKWLSDKKEPLVTGEIKRHLQDHPQKDLEELKNQMELMNAALIVPSLVENKLLAFMALGDKSSGEIYSPDDLHVFTVLASQAALAIENARFLEDAREMQEQISQAEKMATIGTMADGLSHQINNRFHALSLIAGDILDTIKLADTGQYSPEQKDLLGQVRHGLERILANVVQGGEVVKGMLKYSRKGEEGFSAVSLDKVIDATLEMVQYKIKLNRIDIVRDYPNDAPAIRGNLTQLQEVFFNLIDNAYDAMMERQDTFKEDGYRPKIRIYTEAAHNGSLRIMVEDNGIGVKPEDKEKMFTPFFTTKVSSRKGTGLGLYVIKKIVVSNHQGKISVESNYRHGTTFILDLPLYKCKEE